MPAWLLVLALVLPGTLASQAPEPQARTLRLELGLGGGAIGSDFGPGARMTAVYLPRRWGFWFRGMGHIGAEGPLECTTPTSCVTKRQTFYDAGLLVGIQLFRERRLRVVGGAGIGVFGGTAPEFDTSGNRRLEPFSLVGFPLEVGLYTANRGLLGGGIVLTANMNERYAQFGLVLTGSVGAWR